MSRGLPGQHRRTTRRVKVTPAAEPKADGNRAARRAWKRWEARNATQGAFAPEDTSDAGKAAHGAAGRHDGHSADDTDEHYPWSYTEHGVLCICGQPMNADEQCPAAPAERTDTP